MTMAEGSEIGVIASGVGYQYAREALGDGASFLKIGFSWPLPRRLIREFASKVKTLWVVEENDPFLETEIRAMGFPASGRTSCPWWMNSPRRSSPARSWGRTRPGTGRGGSAAEQAAPPLPGVPPQGVVLSLSKKKDVIVTGDIGCLRPRLHASSQRGRATICMGAGFSAAIGFQKAGEKAGRNEKVFGILGDSTFFHSGITGLIDAVVTSPGECSS